MSDQMFERAVRDWLEDGSDRTPPTATNAVLLAIKTTPQERGLRIPWRFPLMPAYVRYAAAVAIVAIVGVGVIAFNVRPPGIGSTTPAPTLTAAPASTPVSSEVARGITAWTAYTSTLYPRMNFRYPADWSGVPATRAWEIGDVFPADELPFAETFVSPDAGDAQIGLVVWEMPHDGNGGPDSYDLLKVWAQTFCNDVLHASACEDFTQDAQPMCHLLGEECDAGDGAILVPTAGAQYGFFRTWQSEMFDSSTVRVVVIAREDGFPSAARYGGSVQLLKSILAAMNVWTPGQVPPA